MSKKLFYESIVERIREKSQKSGTIKLWNNQPSNESKERPTKYPAIYIEFSRVEWGEGQNQVQTAEIVLTVHHIWQSLKREDIEMFDFVESIHTILQGFQTEISTGLDRIAERQDTNHNRVIDWESDYKCSLLDCSAHPNLTRKTITLDSITIVDCDILPNP